MYNANFSSPLGAVLHDPILADNHLDETLLLGADRLTLPEHTADGTSPFGLLAELRDGPGLEMEELFVGDAQMTLVVGLQRQIAGVLDANDRARMDEELGLCLAVALLDSHDVVVTGSQVEDLVE